MEKLNREIHCRNLNHQMNNRIHDALIDECFMIVYNEFNWEIYNELQSKLRDKIEITCYQGLEINIDFNVKNKMKHEKSQ
jgi:hypothetical protein